MKRFVFFFFAICVLASVWIGGSVAGVQQSARDMIDSLYPARYDVTLSNGATLENVSVSFDGDVARIAGGDSIAVSDAEFAGVNTSADKINSVRAGFLSMFLVTVMVASLIGITGFTTALCVMVIRENERRRRSALRRARRVRRARALAFEERRTALPHQAA